jgi:hypothetical protein
LAPICRCVVWQRHPWEIVIFKRGRNHSCVCCSCRTLVNIVNPVPWMLRSELLLCRLWRTLP